MRNTGRRAFAARLAFSRLVRVRPISSLQALQRTPAPLLPPLFFPPRSPRAQNSSIFPAAIPSTSHPIAPYSSKAYLLPHILRKSRGKKSAEYFSISRNPNGSSAVSQIPQEEAGEASLISPQNSRITSRRVADCAQGKFAPSCASHGLLKSVK